MLATRLRRGFSSVASVRQTRVCIVGAGCGGISLAGRISKTGLNDSLSSGETTIVDGAKTYHYKPAWTLYSTKGVGEALTRRSIHDVIPEGIGFINSYVQAIDPENCIVTLQDGSRVQYEQLVISSGIQFDWNRVKGLREALDDPSRPVYSAYDMQSHEKMRTAIDRKFGTAIFTQPQTGITCGGAPQKIAYLTQYAWNQKGFRPVVKLIQGTANIFGSAHYAESLRELVKERGIINIHNHNLIEITQKNTAIFVNTKSQELVEFPFDYLHAVPPMSGQDYLKSSGVVDQMGFVLADKHTMRHPQYPNIWSIGDGSSLPNAKTASATLEQVYVLEKNLERALKNQQPRNSYNGYAACPILVGGGKVIMAEFKYDGVPDQSFGFDQRKPSRSMYWLKRYVFPYAGLYFCPNGTWTGRRTFGFINEESHPTDRST